MRIPQLAGIVAGTAILLAGGTLYAFRGDIRDAYTRYQLGPIPEETVVVRPPSDAADLTEGTVPVAETPSDNATDNTVAVTPTPSPIPEPKPEAMPTGDELPTSPKEEPMSEPPTDTVPAEIPKQLNLKVPMVFQAPFKVWDDIHEDACEEASALMLRAYVTGAGPYTPEQMDEMILASVAYQNEAFGDFHNTTAEQTAQMLREHMGVKTARVIPITSADDIRREIAAGRPVIIPAAGKLLRNPNFRNGGPNYHMFILKGYTADGRFVANDPGTRLGENYVYTEEIIMDAIHDYAGAHMEEGARVAIVAD